MCDGLAQNKIVRVSEKLRSGFTPFVDKVHEIWGQCRRPFVLSNAHDRLSMWRLHFVQQTFAIKSQSRGKPNKCKGFWPQFLGRTTPTFLQQIISATYRPLFGKVWLSSVCWSPSVKPANEAEWRIFGKCVKTHLQSEAACGSKFILFWDDVGDLLSFATHLFAYVCHVSFRKYRPLNLLLSFEIVEKGGFGPRICRGKPRYPTFRTCIFKSHLHVLPTMRPDMDEFRSASSEIRRRIKKKEGSQGKT